MQDGDMPDALDNITAQLAQTDTRLAQMADGDTKAHTGLIDTIKDVGRAVDLLSQRPGSNRFSGEMCAAGPRSRWCARS